MRPPNTWANDARHIPFDQLPDSGIAGTKLVGAQIMGREEYDVCDYRTDLSYTREDGQMITLWRASLQGLHAYAERLRQRQFDRRSSWQARVDAEDEYSDSITALIDKELPSE